MADWEQILGAVAERVEEWAGGGEEGQLGVQGGVEQGAQRPLRGPREHLFLCQVRGHLGAEPPGWIRDRDLCRLR